MLDCYTLSLLSLSITLSIIIMIISTINAILEEKEKATRWEGGFTNKTVWTCYMHVIFIITFCLFVCLFVFWSFSRKKLFSFRIYNCVCKFGENKNKHLFKKKRNCQKVDYVKIRIRFCPYMGKYGSEKAGFSAYFTQCLAAHFQP